MLPYCGVDAASIRLKGLEMKTRVIESIVPPLQGVCRKPSLICQTGEVGGVASAVYRRSLAAEPGEVGAYGVRRVPERGGCRGAWQRAGTGRESARDTATSPLTAGRVSIRYCFALYPKSCGKF